MYYHCMVGSSQLRRTMALSFNNCITLNHQWPRQGSKREPVAPRLVMWTECSYCFKPKPIPVEGEVRQRSRTELAHSQRIRERNTLDTRNKWGTENRARKRKAEQFMEENKGGLGTWTVKYHGSHGYDTHISREIDTLNSPYTEHQRNVARQTLSTKVICNTLHHWCALNMSTMTCHVCLVQKLAGLHIETKNTNNG